MRLQCELVKKTFTDKDGQTREYNALVFTLADGSTLDVTIKSDKAKLLAMSHNVANKKNTVSEDELPSFLR